MDDFTIDLQIFMHQDISEIDHPFHPLSKLVADNSLLSQHEEYILLFVRYP